MDKAKLGYDANGNRVTADGCVYATGADNQLLSDGTYWYAYDAEGNRTARFIDVDQSMTLSTNDTNVTKYAWDNRNRLVEVTDYAVEGGDPTQIVDYFYDVENRWIGENIDSNGDGAIDRQLRFAYDGNQIVLQFDKEGTGEVTVADLSHRYMWQPNAVDQLMADEQLSAATGGGYDQSQPGNVVWTLADNLGTIRDLAVCQDGVTSVANHRVYDSYGNLKSQTNAAVDCLFGFTGRAFDEATGIQNNLNRWYDAKTGRWISEDPTGLTAGDTNDSRYCGNSPTNGTDSTGLSWLSSIGESLGTAIGNAYGTLFIKDHGLDEQILINRKADLIREITDPNSRMTAGDYQRQSIHIMAGAAVDAINDVRAIGSGVAAAGELTLMTTMVTGVGVGLLGALGEGGTMTIAGTWTGHWPWPVHFKYGIEGAWQHAVTGAGLASEGWASGLGGMMIENAVAPTAAYAFRLQLSVLCPGAVLVAPGSGAFSCVTAAMHAFLRGMGCPF